MAFHPSTGLGVQSRSRRSGGGGSRRCNLRAPMTGIGVGALAQQRLEAVDVDGDIAQDGVGRQLVRSLMVLALG